MNTQFFSNRVWTRDPKTRLAWCLSLAGAMLSLCLGAGLLLRSAGTEVVMDHLPAGQFSADVQTFVAALRYLLDPDPDNGSQRATTFNNHSTFAVQETGHQTAAFGYSSNQMQTSKPFTNWPAPI